jgi:hypothetical protein
MIPNNLIKVKENGKSKSSAMYPITVVPLNPKKTKRETAVSASPVEMVGCFPAMLYNAGNTG